MTKTRKPLRPESVVNAAISLSDREGLEALSMRSLAAKLGVEAMSLYNHVPNKDALLDAMLEAVVGEIELPATGADWQTAMKRHLLSAHWVLIGHRWAPLLMVSRVNGGPTMLARREAVLRCLVDAGFSRSQADHAANALDSYLFGFTIQQLNLPFTPREYQRTARQYVHLLSPSVHPHLSALTQDVIAGKHTGVHEFEFGLDALLAGLGHVARAVKGKPSAKANRRLG